MRDINQSQSGAKHRWPGSGRNLILQCEVSVLFLHFSIAFSQKVQLERPIQMRGSASIELADCFDERELLFSRGVDETFVLNCSRG